MKLFELAEFYFLLHYIVDFKFYSYSLNIIMKSRDNWNLFIDKRKRLMSIIILSISSASYSVPKFITGFILKWNKTDMKLFELSEIYFLLHYIADFKFYSYNIDNTIKSRGNSNLFTIASTMFATILSKPFLQTL